MTDIQVGDVCLDLCQGRAVHVIEDTDMAADEWSEANGYGLVDNYGNSRMGATTDDSVFEVVYCNNLKSQPSKTYAMPSSRLGRVETEAADDGRPVADRVRSQVLESLFTAAQAIDFDAVGFESSDAPVRRLASEAGFPDDVIDEARELADVEQTIGGDDA